MSDKMMLTLQDLQVLAATAERNGTSRNFPEVALQWAAGAQAEIERLRDAVRSARADEAHCWARRVDALTAQLREVDARYMALLKAVADGVAMQPRTVALDLGPNVF